MISYCEECHEEMNSVDARWSRLCHMCGRKCPQWRDIHALYTNPAYGTWDHLREFQHAKTHMRGGSSSQFGLHGGPGLPEDHPRD